VITLVTDNDDVIVIDAGLCALSSIPWRYATLRKSFYATQKCYILFTQTTSDATTALAALRKQIETTSIFSTTAETNATNQRATINLRSLRRGATRCVKKYARRRGVTLHYVTQSCKTRSGTANGGSRSQGIHGNDFKIWPIIVRTRRRARAYVYCTSLHIKLAKQTENNIRPYYLVCQPIASLWTKDYSIQKWGEVHF